MKLSINLVTWNGAKYIIDCLDSIFNQSFADYSILILDNGSTDETVELINEKYPHLKIVRNKENMGFAKAHNKAIHWSKSEYVLILNQDIILGKDYLKHLVDFLEKDKECGAATGKLLRLQDQQKTKYIDSAGLKIFKNHRVVDLGAGEQDEGQYDAIEEIFGVSGAAPVYRKQALQSVEMDKQFFDEDFFSYKEDIDLAYRLQYAGWKAFKVPLSVAYHDRTVTTPVKDMNKMQVAKARKRKSKFANYYSYKNHFYFLIKNVPSRKLKYIWPVFWYEFIKFIFVLFLETRNLKVLREVWKNRKKFQEKRERIVRKINLKEVEKWFA